MRIPNLHKFPSGEDHLVSYCVYDVGVSIAATGVTLEHSIGIGVSVGYVPAHRLCSHRSLNRLRNSSTHFWGCAIVFDPSGSNHCPAHSWTGRYVCGEIKAQPSRQSNLTLRYGRKICYRNFLNSQPVQKVQRRIKFFRFVRRLLKSVRLRSYFRRKDNACLSLPPNIFSRIYLKVVQVSLDFGLYTL